MASDRRGKNRTVPELDGLRGLAISGVLLSHVDERVFSLGWSGVTLFFVLSGFLITGVLLDARNGPKYFLHFYVRRTLRIFPAYYFILLLSFGILAVGQRTTASQESPAAHEIAYFILYLQNYWLGINAFSTSASSLLSFTWSLAIEEQFYLLWPLAVFFFRSRVLIVICVLLIIVGPMFREWTLATTGNPLLTLSTLPGQADGLALGALLAVMSRSEDAFFERYRRSAVRLLIFTSISLLLLIFLTGWYAYASPFLWMGIRANAALITILVFFFGALLALALSRPRVLSAVLSQPAITFVGRISYGLYLYHTMAFWLTSEMLVHIPSSLHKLGPVNLHWPFALALTFAIAATSYRHLESPFLSLKDKFR